MRITQMKYKIIFKTVKNLLKIRLFKLKIQLNKIKMKYNNYKQRFNCGIIIKFRQKSSYR